MIDEHEIKERILQELMEEMRNSDGKKLEPKAVEVSVSSMKPEEFLKEGENPDRGPMGEAEMGMDHKEPDGDEFSPEEMSLLESLMGKDEEKEE